MAAIATKQRFMLSQLCNVSRRAISTTTVHHYKTETGHEEKELVTEGVKQTSLNILSGIPHQQSDRKAVIYLPTRSAMTSGTHNMRKWTLKFDTKERWENPLMGWSSTGDPLSNTVLEFNTREAAMNYCDTHGWKYEVKEPALPKLNKNSYASNFAWNKRTRTSSK